MSIMDGLRWRYFIVPLPSLSRSRIDLASQRDSFNAGDRQSDWNSVSYECEGAKAAAVIDLKTHKALWEDIADVLVSRSGRHERGMPLEKVKASLVARGKLHG